MREINNFPFIETTFNDTMELLQEARTFAAYRLSSANDNGNSFDSFHVTSETSRLVSHLTNVMTWILWQKAADSGEVSSRKAHKMSAHHLDAEIFSEREISPEVDLPHILENLIGRADLLHARVARINQMAP